MPLGYSPSIKASRVRAWFSGSGQHESGDTFPQSRSESRFFSFCGKGPRNTECHLPSTPKSSDPEAAPGSKWQEGSTGWGLRGSLLAGGCWGAWWEGREEGRP